jgi:adenosyl cobinamide kinase/adenosyl cobinamide phosphate guanylyltransferase
VRYLATARRRPGDAEWDARIAAHRARRPEGWTTVEEPDLPSLLRAAGQHDAPLLVDDLATWLTGVLDDAGAWERPEVPPEVAERVAAVVEAVAGCAGHVVLVSAEVGLGVVPATRSGRMFRDELGALNAALAAVCNEVVLLVAGLPLRLK